MTTGHPQQDQSCPVWQARLEAFVDGELTPHALEAVRAHLRACPACLAEVQALAELSQDLRQLGAERAPPALWDRIAAGLDVETPRAAGLRSPRGLQPFGLSRRAALMAASLAAVAAAGAYTLLPSDNSVIAASVNDFITYRARGWTVDHTAQDVHSLSDWAQARVSFAVPELKERLGDFEVRGVRLCWLLDRRLLGLTYANGDDRAVVYVMEAKGLVLPAADRTLPDGRRASVQHVKGHGVALWAERDLVFVLVAAQKDFARALQLAGQRAEGSAGIGRSDRDTS
jgi:anti-sigma factor (TIGR02949 family)